jgi:acyl dehydratase
VVVDGVHGADVYASMSAAPSPAAFATPAPLRRHIAARDLERHGAFLSSMALPPGSHGQSPAAAAASCLVAAQLPALWGVLLDPARGLSFMRMAHIAHDVEFSDVDVVVGDVISTTAAVDSISDGPTGDIVVIALHTTNQRDERLLRSRCTVLRREPRRRGEDLTTTPPSLSTTTPPTTTTTMNTTAAIAQTWAEASGDPNPINVDDEAAILAGLPGPVFGTTTVFMMVMAALGMPRHLALTYRRPVVVGDDVVIRSDGIGVVVDAGGEGAVAYGAVSTRGTP